MARIDLSIPSLGNKFIDIRESIPGDSFNWSWVRPLSEVKYLAIHHSGGPDNQTPNEIANYHINNNGWGGIGYHFLIASDGGVYYVGDLSTARANVANLNEQVIGICLIGNFTSGRIPTAKQFESAQNLCSFFIESYPDLSNVNSWDCVRGHKELPGQVTTCPGDNWSSWRSNITEEVISPDRGAQITELYRIVLGRDPDMGGLQAYTNGPMDINQIMKAMVISSEHQNLIKLAKDASSLKSQVDNLQTTLASLNQQSITLKETLQEREQEINNLKANAVSIPTPTLPQIPPEPTKPVDNSVAIVGLLISLYKFIFPRSTQ